MGLDGAHEPGYRGGFTIQTEPDTQGRANRQRRRYAQPILKSIAYIYFGYLHAIKALDKGEEPDMAGDGGDGVIPARRCILGL
ncbi:hypothetical protein [Bradyrhizobium sp.]|uniref:hypothetical protein n=1 Tax=Bradyrhizobium sp. TaxID=376 RepID=UPI002629474A|nr:hypothetical protein [Bradyrhizobium sp.]